MDGMIAWQEPEHSLRNLFIFSFSFRLDLPSPRLSAVLMFSHFEFFMIFLQFMCNHNSVPTQFVSLYEWQHQQQQQTTHHLSSPNSHMPWQQSSLEWNYPTERYMSICWYLMPMPNPSPVKFNSVLIQPHHQESGYTTNTKINFSNFKTLNERGWILGRRRRRIDENINNNKKYFNNKTLNMMGRSK